MGQSHVVSCTVCRKWLELETWHGDDRCAGVETHVQDNDQTVNMKKRKETNQRVVAGKVFEAFHLTHVGYEIVSASA